MGLVSKLEGVGWFGASARLVCCVTLLGVTGCDDGGAQPRNAGAAGSGGDPSQGTAGAAVNGGEGVQPWWSLPAGSRYFERDGQRAPLLMRNATAPSVAAFATLLQAAHAAGAKAIRIQLTQGFGYETLGIDSRGGVLPTWAASWDAVLEEAKQQELAVVPVFAIWGDWNSGSPAHGWVHFEANPLNQAKGGPAASPAELFDDTATQQAWLGWLAALIDRWKTHPNVIAWEVFSELDLATGANEANATAFAERASDVIREHDPWARPVLASTSDLPLIQGAPWTTLWAGRANDLVSLHPYAAELDSVAVGRVKQALAATTKPIFIGESGVDSAEPKGNTLSTSPAARVGLQQAVWAELVSGAANARALYWEDGYAAYYPESGLPFVQTMNDLDRSAATWLEHADFAGFSGAELSGTPPLFGAALARDSEVRGWARNALLTAPNWSAAPVADVTLQIALPAEVVPGAWTLSLTDPEGEALPDVAGQSSAGRLTFSIPGPFTSVAFVARRN